MSLTAAQLEQAEVVLANLLHRNVSRGRGDADQFGVVAGEQIHQRHRVVDARVDVGEDGQRASARSLATVIPSRYGRDAVAACLEL